MADPDFANQKKKQFQPAGGNSDNNKADLKSKSIPAPAYQLKKDEGSPIKKSPFELIGDYTEAGRILVPAGSSQEAQYDYYSKIITEAGGNFISKEGHINLLGIRGTIIDTEGNIRQTGSSAAYKKAQEEGDVTGQSHFSESKIAKKQNRSLNNTELQKDNWDDIMVSLSIENNVKKVKVRKSSVDPDHSGNKIGTAHLVDGQYDFKVGVHRTTIREHIKLAMKLAKENKLLDGKVVKTEIDEHGKKQVVKYSYLALSPCGKIKVIRDGAKMNQGKNAKKVPASGSFSNEELINAKKQHKKSNPAFVDGKGIAINFHLGDHDGSFSEGCINIDPEEYVQFMQEFVDAKKEHKQKIIKFTLIDASKVALQIVKNNTKEESTKDSDQNKGIYNLFQEFMKNNISSNKSNVPAQE